MNRITSAIAILLAAVLLPAAVAAEQQASPAEASGASAITATPAATDTSTGKRDKQSEREPEWPQPRCEAPAE